MRPMLATPGYPRADRRGLVARGEVGRCAGAGRHHPRRAPGCSAATRTSVTVAWPELNRCPLGDRDLLVDGEVIALNERGLPDFRVLQDRMHVRKRRGRGPARRPAAGDVHGLRPACALDGKRPHRRSRSASAARLLRGLGLEHSTWQVPDAYDDGPMLFDATLQQGLEGIVSKRLTSRYAFGRADPATG